MHKVLFITNHPSPHMADLFRAVHRHPDMELRVIFGAPADPARSWGADADGFPSVVLPRVPIGTRLPLNRGILRTVFSHVRSGYTPIVCVYTMPSSLLSAVALSLGRRPWLLMAEAPGLDYAAGDLKQAARRWCLRRLLSGCAGVLAISANAVERFSEIAPLVSVRRFQYFMDLPRFRQTVRARSGRCVSFLVCGALSALKSPDVAVRASERLHAEGLTHALTLAGDGPLRQGLEEYCRARGLDHIRFLGALPWQRRHEAFAQADVLVHPTRHDGWGMVVPEALVSGMPVVTTKACGAGVDFVRDGANGFLIGAPARQEDLVERMAHFIRDPGEVARMGQLARESVRGWNSQEGARRLWQALGELLPRSRRLTAATTIPEP